MNPTGHPGGGRHVLLLLIAALLTAGALFSAIGAQGGSPISNKADGYGGGGPIPQKPTNPKSKGDCAKYYGQNNPTPDARECNAKATFNAAKKSCSRKKTKTAKANCLKRAKKAYARAQARIDRQRKAEKGCQDRYNAGLQQLDPDAEDYNTKSQELSDEYSSCLQSAQKG